MNIKSNYFKITLGILLALVVIFMAQQVSFIFEPVVLLFKTLVTPFLIAGILYYLLQPIYAFLIKRKMNKGAAIISIYLALIGLFAGVIYYIVPLVSEQFKKLLSNLPTLIKEIQEIIQSILKSEGFERLKLQENIDFSKITAPLIEFSNKTLNYVGNNVMNIFTFVTDFALLIIVIPFLLFYLLKDSDKIPNLLTKGFNVKHRVEVIKVLKEANDKLSFYIQGQMLVSLILGVLLYIGYLIIGLDYALVLAIIAMVANIIPFLGPTIGMVFAMAVAMTQSLNMVVLVVVVVLIIQAVDSNYISPKVLGDKLDIHPLTIIFILLFAGNLGGIVAMLVAVPVYSIGKVIVLNAYRLYKISKMEKKQKKNPFID